MSRRVQLGILAAAAIAGVLVLLVLVVLPLRENPAPLVLPAAYNRCILDFQGTKAELVPPEGDRLLSLCNEILKERCSPEDTTRRGDFHYESGENLAFYADEKKTGLAGRIQFWDMGPKRAKVTVGSVVRYCGVSDELYGRICAEVERLRAMKYGRSEPKP